MTRQRLWKVMMLTSAALALLVALALVGPAAFAGPTIQVYKSPT
jgi:uncharacterized protein YhdP